MDEDQEERTVHLFVQDWWSVCGDSQRAPVVSSRLESVTCEVCLSYRAHCQHRDFDESMDGSGTCRDCGLYMEGLADELERQ